VSADDEMGVVVTDAAGVDVISTFGNRDAETFGDALTLGVVEAHGRVFQCSLGGEALLDVVKVVGEGSLLTGLGRGSEFVQFPGADEVRP
jgi:hypothetical protein